MEPGLVMLAQAWVCVPLPEGLGWGDRGSLSPNSEVPWLLGSEEALLVPLLGPVSVSWEAQLLELGTEGPPEDSR